MDTKNFLLIISALSSVSCAGLLRTPKVYNALITTDENLTPSRAFPVIQPTIHETGIVQYPFDPLGPYRFLNPALGQFPQPGVHFRGPPPGYIPSGPSAPSGPPMPVQPPQMKPPVELPPPSGPEMQLPQPVPQNPGAEPPRRPEEPPRGQPPIPLNELGLPPSLVPLHSLPPHRNPINLQPYPYNNYPLIYETQNLYQDHYLPPYSFYSPPSWINQIPQANRPEKIPSQEPLPPQNINPPQTQLQPQSQPAKETERSEPVEASSSSNFENIKNGSNSKHKDVPDVPPPPIPSGAKTSSEDEAPQEQSSSA